MEFVRLVQFSSAVFNHESVDCGTFGWWVCRLRGGGKVRVIVVNCVCTLLNGHHKLQGPA